MTFLWQLVQILIWMYVASLVAGALAYAIGRMRRSLPAPAPAAPVHPAPLAAVLGEARQEVLVVALCAAITVQILTGGRIDVVWAAAAAAAIWGLTICPPPYVTWSRPVRVALLATASVLGVMIGAMLPRPTAVDRLLVIFLALGPVAVWMRVRCRAMPPAAAPRASAAVHELSQQQHSPAWSGTPRPGAAPEHIRLPHSPAEIMTAVGLRIVGQDQALRAWQSLLERETAFFGPHSTKPFSVLHLGPPSAGKEALCRALADELGISLEIVAGDQLGTWANQVGRGLRPRPGCLVVTLPERMPDDLKAEVSDLVLGRMPFWNRTMIIVLSEALMPDPTLDQAALREILVGAGLDRGLALGVQAVVPFVPLEAWALAGVAAKIFSDEARHHGMELRWFDPEALDEVVLAIPAAARDQGAAGVAFGIAQTIGRKLDEAKGNGWRSIRVEKTPAGVAVLQEA